MAFYQTKLNLTNIYRWVVLGIENMSFEFNLNKALCSDGLLPDFEVWKISIADWCLTLKIWFISSILIGYSIFVALYHKPCLRVIHNWVSDCILVMIFFTSLKMLYFVSLLPVKIKFDKYLTLSDSKNARYGFRVQVM